MFVRAVCYGITLLGVSTRELFYFNHRTFCMALNLHFQYWIIHSQGLTYFKYTTSGRWQSLAVTWFRKGAVIWDLRSRFLGLRRRLRVQISPAKDRCLVWAGCQECLRQFNRPRTASPPCEHLCGQFIPAALHNSVIQDGLSYTERLTSGTSTMSKRFCSPIVLSIHDSGAFQWLPAPALLYHDRY